MKQNTFKWLNCSLILLIALSCKKEKGALDNLAPGRFNYVCIWNKNGVQDTLVGILSGPYLQAGNYEFRVKKSLENTNNYFKILGYKTLTNFNVPESPIVDAAPIIYSDHDSDNLLINFQSSTMNGSFKLTRKQ